MPWPDFWKGNRIEPNWLVVFLLILILIAVSRNRGGGRTEGPFDSILGFLFGTFSALAIVVLAVVFIVAVLPG